MINLLPEQQRREVRREYFSRLAIVSLIFASLCFLAGTAALLPSFILSRAREAALSDQAAVLTHSVELASATGSDKKLQNAKDHLALLSARLGESSPRELLSLLIEQKKNGITLSRFAFARNPSGAMVVTVAGKASDRETLVAFSETLKKVPAFTSSNLPISNFAQSQSIPFTITVTVAESAMETSKK